jgi:hypothetical protein
MDRIARERPPEALALLKHASASRPSGEWNDDDFVLADGLCERARSAWFGISLSCVLSARPKTNNIAGGV